MTIKPRTASSAGRVALAMFLLVLGGTPTRAQQTTITPNYKDADLSQIVEAVSEITKKKDRKSVV